MIGPGWWVAARAMADRSLVVAQLMIAMHRLLKSQRRQRARAEEAERDLALAIRVLGRTANNLDAIERIGWEAIVERNEERARVRMLVDASTAMHEKLRDAQRDLGINRETSACFAKKSDRLAAELAAAKEEIAALRTQPVAARAGTGGIRIGNRFRRAPGRHTEGEAGEGEIGTVVESEMLHVLKSSDGARFGLWSEAQLLDAMLFERVADAPPETELAKPRAPNMSDGFVCDGCGKWTPFSQGASDGMPGSCDACWSAKRADAALPTPVNRGAPAEQRHAVDEVGDCASWCDACRIESDRRRTCSNCHGGGGHCEKCMAGATTGVEQQGADGETQDEEG